MTTIAIGAAIGAGVGAVATYAAGGRGDALWKGALTGAVGGALTAGVGSWATSAGGLALGNVAGYALGGAVGGVGAGALGTALSGGTGEDYLRNIATGGILGGATGALGGYLAPGAEAGVNPVTGEAVPTGSPEITALPDAEAASGVQTGTTAAPAVQTSVTGATAAPTQATTTTPLADTVANVSQGNAQFAPFGGDTAATTTTAPTTSGATPSLGETAFTYDDYPSQAMINQGTANPMGTQAAADSYQFKMKDLGADMGMDTFGYGKTLGQTATTGTGKMGLEDYLKMQGKAQLIGGGIKALGALATAPETQQNRQQLMDLYNQQNAANQYYQNLMQNTYQNPMGYLGSGEAAATRSAALQKALAMNAQAGRRTQGGALANQLMQAQLANLQNYRRGIPQPQYGTAAQTLNYAQQYSPTADIFGGLASMATPLSLYSLFG